MLPLFQNILICLRKPSPITDSLLKKEEVFSYLGLFRKDLTNHHQDHTACYQPHVHLWEESWSCHHLEYIHAHKPNPLHMVPALLHEFPTSWPFHGIHPFPKASSLLSSSGEITLFLLWLGLPYVGFPALILSDILVLVWQGSKTWTQTSCLLPPSNLQSISNIHQILTFPRYTLAQSGSLVKVITQPVSSFPPSNGLPYLEAVLK